MTIAEKSKPVILSSNWQLEDVETRCFPKAMYVVFKGIEYFNRGIPSQRLDWRSTYCQVRAFFFEGGEGLMREK